MKDIDCCVFAGQGAQVPGMGRDFAESDPELMAIYDRANDVLGFDLKKLCFEGPQEELTKSNVCQPAVFVTSYVAYQAFQKKAPTKFLCAGGLSLGEWTALCAAGVLDFESTLKVLEARGRFMQEACEETPSGMIAIIGASFVQLVDLCKATGCTLANINNAYQQVLSGSKDQIVAAQATAKSMGIKKAIPLATAGAFHSPFMQSAREKLAKVIEPMTFNKPQIPVLSNVTGTVHMDDPELIKTRMLEQITGTTNWASNVEVAKSIGCLRFVEFGPGKVLTGLIRKIDSGLTALSVSDLETLGTASAIVGGIR